MAAKKKVKAQYANPRTAESAKILYESAKRAGLPGKPGVASSLFARGEKWGTARGEKMVNKQYQEARKRRASRGR
jgi:hypothetical protein